MKREEKLKSAELNKAAEILKRGGVVVFPTDTAYGIGCVWNNELAKTRISKIKNSNQNFPILVSSFNQLHQIANINGPAQHLINKYWPGGLTLIVESKHDGKKIGVRMPNSEVVQALIEITGVPLIGTSANFHGKKTPTAYKDLEKEFLKKADFVVRGVCELKQESTVVDTTVVPLRILRQGAVKIL